MLQVLMVGTFLAFACLEVAHIVGSAALLFDPTRISEMTNALQRLYEDEELRYSLSVKSLQRSQIFSWSKTADATLKAIKNVAAKSRK